MDFNLLRFFEVMVRFECSDFSKLIALLELIPMNVSEYFTLDKNCVITPNDGYDKSEDNIYTLHIRIHPGNITSKYTFRMQLNDYLDEITDVINKSINS